MLHYQKYFVGLNKKFASCGHIMKSDYIEMPVKNNAKCVVGCTKNKDFCKKHCQ